jgi:hypothetical protein
MPATMPTRIQLLVRERMGGAGVIP